MNNDNNELIKIITKIENKRNIKYTEYKINMQVLSTMSNKTNDDIKKAMKI